MSPSENCTVKNNEHHLPDQHEFRKSQASSSTEIRITILRLFTTNIYNQWSHGGKEGITFNRNKNIYCLKIKIKN